MTVTTPSVNQFLGAQRHQRSLENVRREFKPPVLKHTIIFF